VRGCPSRGGSVGAKIRHLRESLGGIGSKMYSRQQPQEGGEDEADERL